MEAKILSDRAFGFTFAAVFALISVVGWFVFNTLLVWAVFLCGTFLALALFVPWILLPLNRTWLWLAHSLGHVVNFLILGVFSEMFFYTVLISAHASWLRLAKVSRPTILLSTSGNVSSGSKLS